MIAELLKGSNNGVLGQGDFGRVAELYEQHRRMMIKLRKEYNKQKDACVEDLDLHNKPKGNSGQKKDHDLAPLLGALKAIPLKNRTTQRLTATALGILESTLFENLNKLVLRSCLRFFKPLLLTLVRCEGWSGQ